MKILTKDTVDNNILNALVSKDRFENFSLIPSISIRKNKVETIRCIAGGLAKEKILLAEIKNIIRKLNGPKFSFDDFPDSFDEVYLGYKKDNHTYYRIYCGNNGSGHCIEWIKASKSFLPIKEYINIDFNDWDLETSDYNAGCSKDLLTAISKILNKNSSKSAMCISEGRKSIDIGLGKETSSMLSFRKEIIDLFEYFGHKYRNIYKFFLDTNRCFSLYRIQWGTSDNNKNEFVNLYFI